MKNLMKTFLKGIWMVIQFALYAFGLVGGVACAIVCDAYLMAVGVLFLAVLAFPHIRRLIVDR